MINRVREDQLSNLLAQWTIQYFLMVLIDQIQYTRVEEAW